MIIENIMNLITKKIKKYFLKFNNKYFLQATDENTFFPF